LSSAHESYSQRAVTAGDVYRALWRHKFFIAVLTAVFVGATWYVTSGQTRKYEASTLLRVQERGADAGSTSAALLSQTYARIIGSGALEGDIRRLVSRCSPPAGAPTSVRRDERSCGWMGSRNRRRVSLRQLSEATLSASPVEDLDLLSITARSRNPTRAMVVANAAPLALRSFIRRTGAPSEKIVIVKAATVPTSPVSRQLPLKIAIALMLGLIFNGALALLIELFRDRLPQTDELEQTLGHPVLATIPTLRLHPIGAVEAPREEPESVLTAQRSLDGEGRPRSADPRIGPGS
jgi:capsular polysaccharide biosynthesis protein